MKKLFALSLLTVVLASCGAKTEDNTIMSGATDTTVSTGTESNTQTPATDTMMSGSTETMMDSGSEVR